LNTNVPIPLKHAIKIEKLTKGEIKAKELRPDVYED
jgi:DNA-binding transcriptional regulator YdaS (Cro superfamily)